MALLGALEHGIYVDNEDEGECLGMSTAQICQYFGIEQDSDDDDDAIFAEDEHVHHPGGTGDEDSLSDDAEEVSGDEGLTFDDADDWLGYLSEGEDEGMREEEQDVGVHRHFLGIIFIRKCSRFLPLIVMRVVSIMRQSPSQTIHLPLKNGLTFTKILLQILNF
jgi:hypothetical protein